MAFGKAECKSHSVRSYNDVSICYQLPCAEALFFIVIDIRHVYCLRFLKQTPKYPIVRASNRTIQALQQPLPQPLFLHFLFLY